MALTNEYIPYENFTISGYTGSLAEVYANKYGFNFVSLGKADYSALLRDINFNGTIEIADAVLLQKYLLGSMDFNNLQFILGDINEDGNVNVFDMVLMRRMLVNLRR